MDKQSGEELASTLDANPSEPIQPAAPATPVAPVAEPAPAAPVAEPTAAVNTTPVAGAPVKKKKTGLIVGVTVGALALIGGGTAAAIILLNNKSSGPENPTEAIADTVAGMLTGEKSNLGFDGVAKMSTQGINFTFKFNGETAGTEGKGGFEIGVDGMGMNVSASVDGIFKNSTAYIKAEGIKDIINKYGLSMLLGTSTAKKLQSIDGNWYKLPVTITSSSDYQTILPQSSSSCSLDMEKMIEERDKVAEIYKKHNFFKAEKYTGNDVEKKKSDLYKLDIDKTELANFAKEIADEYASNSRCTAEINSSSLESIDLSAIKVLAEFDKNNISRLYASGNMNGTDASLDVSIYTPDSVKIEAPSDAKSADELIESLSPLFKMYGGSFSLGGGSSTIDNCSPYGSTNCIDYDDDDYDYDYDYDDDDDDDHTYDYDDDDDSSYSDMLKQLQDLTDQYGSGSSSSTLEGLDLDGLEDLLNSSDAQNSLQDILNSLQ